jgi:hypothetical protein
MYNQKNGGRVEGSVKHIMQGCYTQVEAAVPSLAELLALGLTNPAK